MSLIDEIRAKVASNTFEFSQHALDQTLLRNISVDEVREAIASAEVIEDYPADKYGRAVFYWAGRPRGVRCTSSAVTRRVR